MRRVGRGQQDGGGVELRALALVDGHRVDGVDRGEPRGAELERSRRGARTPRHAAVGPPRRRRRCRRCRAAARSRSRSRAAGGRRTSRRAAEAVDACGEPALDARRPGADAVRAAAVRAQHAEARRARRAPPARVAGARRPRATARAAADGAARAPAPSAASPGRRRRRRSSVTVARARRATRVGVAARGSPRRRAAIAAAEAVDAVEHDDRRSGADPPGRRCRRARRRPRSR